MLAPGVTSVTSTGGYALAVTFADGVRREVDLADEIGVGVFAALRDPALFAKVSVEGVGIGWPNGASLSPEFLYHDAKRATRV